jgi:hypothetical protein
MNQGSKFTFKFKVSETYKNPSGERLLKFDTIQQPTIKIGILGDSVSRSSSEESKN